MENRKRCLIILKLFVVVLVLINIIYKSETNLMSGDDGSIIISTKAKVLSVNEQNLELEIKIKTLHFEVLF